MVVNTGVMMLYPGRIKFAANASGNLSLSSVFFQKEI